MLSDAYDLWTDNVSIDDNTTFSIRADRDKKQVVVLGVLRNELQADWHVACENPMAVVDAVFKESAIGMSESQVWIETVYRSEDAHMTVIVGHNHRWDTPWQWLQGVVRRAVADDMRHAFGGTYAQTVNA